MNTLTLEKIQLQRKYDSLQPYARNGELAPRVGFYKILSVTQRDFQIMVAPIAKAIWSDSLETLTDGIEVEIQLISLERNATGPIDELRKGLAGQTIEVTTAILKEKGWNASHYSITWRIAKPVMPIDNILFRLGSVEDINRATYESLAGEDKNSMRIALEHEVERPLYDDFPYND